MSVADVRIEKRPSERDRGVNWVVVVLSDGCEEWKVKSSSVSGRRRVEYEGWMVRVPVVEVVRGRDKLLESKRVESMWRMQRMQAGRSASGSGATLHELLLVKVWSSHVKAKLLSWCVSAWLLPF